MKCKRCGLPIHSEAIMKGLSPHTKVWNYVHDNYKEAWKVDEKGYAHALHFAEPEKDTGILLKPLTFSQAGVELGKAYRCRTKTKNGSNGLLAEKRRVKNEKIVVES